MLFLAHHNAAQFIYDCNPHMCVCGFFGDPERSGGDSISAEKGGINVYQSSQGCQPEPDTFGQG
jgi:hypothetical protein